MTSTSKLIGIALTGTSVVGAGAGTYYALNSSTTTPKSKISELIRTSGRKILSITATNVWDIKLDVYEKSFKSLLDLPKTGEEGLKEWCQKTLDTEIEISKKDEENSNFKIALNLCTKPTNKEKLLKDSTKTIAGANDWENKKATYIAAPQVADTDIPTITNKAQATAKQISDWCDENIYKEFEDTGNTYKIAEKWCVNP